jgi:murein DD-endopeptidase MepM/ murein hydrolase activator NlpD
MVRWWVVEVSSCRAETLEMWSEAKHMGRLSTALLTLIAMALLSVPALAQTSDEETTEQGDESEEDNSAEIETKKAERAELRQQQISASKNLNFARIESDQLASALADIDSEVALKSAQLESTRLQLGTALAQAEEATVALAETLGQKERLLSQVTDLAVAGFLQSASREGLIFDVGDVNEAVRQDFMLRESNTAPNEVLNQLRAIEEDNAIAKATLDAANVESLLLESQLSLSLDELAVERETQAVLQAEMDRRIAAWEGQVQSLSDAVDDITRFLQDKDPDNNDPNRPPPDPSDPSVQGFQWPYNGRVGSGYGYRIHPIYRTKRLHTGLDIGGSSGDPIYAAKGGEVIWAKRRGGYGHTVLIDHGDGITTLYAHMSSYESSFGDFVTRGDVIGYIGSTGTSTSPHLHFEVRVNGNPVDPMPYLP